MGRYVLWVGKHVYNIIQCARVIECKRAQHRIVERGRRATVKNKREKKIMSLVQTIIYYYVLIIRCRHSNIIMPRSLIIIIIGSQCTVNIKPVVIAIVPILINISRDDFISKPANNNNCHYIFKNKFPTCFQRRKNYYHTGQ